MGNWIAMTETVSMPAVYRFMIVCLVLLFCGSSQAKVAPPDIDLQVKLNEALLRRIEISQTSSRIAQLVSRGAYREAEQILDDLLISKRMSDDGHRVLELVYFQLAIMENPRIWDRWCKARPSSHYPFTVRGMHYLERARFLDGANQTLLLTEKQREEFNRSLLKAQADLQKAVELSDFDPGPAAALTTLSIHLKLPRSEMEKWFDQAYKFDPYWLGIYRAKLLYLAPWWYGSNQLMEEFASQCFLDQLPGSNTYIVALEYYKLRADRLGKGQQGEQYLLDPVVYHRVSSGLTRYQDEYPRSLRMGSYRALHARAFTQLDQAVAAFSRTLSGNSKDLQARKGRVHAFLKIGQYKRAAADLKIMEKRQGETPFSLVSRGKIALQTTNDTELGHSYFEQAIAQETSSYRRKWYLFERGERYRQLGDYQSAIADYSGAVREDPLFEDAYFARAQAKYELDDIQGALADLAIIKGSIKGRLTPKARTLTNTYLQKKVTYTGGSEAENSLERILRRHEPSHPQQEQEDSPDHGHRDILVRGLRFFYQGDYQQARRDFYRVLSLDFTNPKAYYMLGLIGVEHEFDQIESCIFFKQAYREDPETPDYLISVSRCLYRERNFPAAIELLSGFINREKELEIDNKTAAQIHFLRGLCLEESGLIPEALKDMQRAYKLDPSLRAAGLFVRDHTPKSSAGEITKQPVSTPPAIQPVKTDIEDSLKQLNEEGQRQLIEGNVAAAKISFLKAIRLNPEASTAYHQLGRLYFEHEQNYYKARLYYSQAIERNNQTAHYYFDRAAIHFYFKQYDLAREDFNRVLLLEPDHQRSLYYRGVCNHYLGDTEAARTDFQLLRQSDHSWNIEIERFRNAWRAEVDQFLNES